MNDYISWDFLGTFSGVVGAVLLIVQFFKVPLDRVWKIPTRYFVWAVSMVTLMMVELVKRNVLLENIPIIILNSVIVATAAMGSYEVIQKEKLKLK